MKWKMVAALALTVAVAAFAFAARTPAISHTSTTVAPAAAASVPEPHPQIREAIAALRRAKEHMEHAAHDFGGHRVEALKATDEAIRQLEVCLKYDKN